MKNSNQPGARLLWLFVTLALVIVAGVIAAVLVNRGPLVNSPDGPSSQTDAAVTTAPRGTVVDYHGAGFKILVCNEERSTTFGSTDSAPTVLSRIVGSEGLRLSDELNLDFRAVRLASPKSYVSAAKAAGEGDTADLIVTAVYTEGAEMLASGLLADIGTYPALCVDVPFFDSDLTNSLSLCGERFLLFGAATLGVDDALRVMTVRRDAADAAALLATAAEGKWTLDAFRTAALTADGSLSLDTEYADATDWWLSAGATDATAHDYGFTVTVGNATGTAVIDALRRTVFGGNRTSLISPAFTVTTLGTFGAANDGALAVLPMPKYAEDAADVSYADPTKATALALTSFCDEGVRSSVVAYYLCAETAETFAGENEKNLSKGESVQWRVLDRILENRRIGILELYDFRAVLAATLTELCDAKADTSDLLERRIVLMQFSLDTAVGDIEEELIRVAREDMQKNATQ